VELPLCSFDLRTGIFCPRCAEKLRKGLYSELDVRVMKKLLELEKSFSKLQKAGYVKSVDCGDVVFVVLKNGSLSGFEFRELARLRKALSSEVGKPVRIVEDDPDPVKFIERVAAPARIVAVNKIWLPDGSEETRVIFDRERSLKIGGDALIKVVGEVKKIKLSVDFERRGWRSAIPRKGRARKAVAK